MSIYRDLRFEKENPRGLIFYCVLLNREYLALSFINILTYWHRSCHYSMDDSVLTSISA
jgi:hypothetical protein